MFPKYSDPPYKLDFIPINIRNFSVYYNMLFVHVRTFVWSNESMYERASAEVLDFIIVTRVRLWRTTGESYAVNRVRFLYIGRVLGHLS